MHVAQSYVYRMSDGTGYVGRSPQGNGKLIARRGDTLDDETVKALGLEDLEDHTDYAAGIKAANEVGAPVTAVREDGSIGVKVKGKWAGDAKGGEE